MASNRESGITPGTGLSKLPLPLKTSSAGVCATLTAGAGDSIGAGAPGLDVGSCATAGSAAKNNNAIPGTAFVLIMATFVLRYRGLDASAMVFRFIVLRLPISDMNNSSAHRN